MLFDLRYGRVNEVMKRGTSGYFDTHDNLLSDTLKICRFVDHRCGRAKIRSRTYSSCGRSTARRRTASGSFCELEAAPKEQRALQIQVC